MTGISRIQSLATTLLLFGSATAEIITGDVFADNTSTLFVNGQQVARDPIAFTPHNNTVRVQFEAEYPLVLAIRRTRPIRPASEPIRATITGFDILADGSHYRLSYSHRGRNHVWEYQGDAGGCWHFRMDGTGREPYCSRDGKSIKGQDAREPARVEPPPSATGQAAGRRLKRGERHDPGSGPYLRFRAVTCVPARAWLPRPIRSASARSDCAQPWGRLHMTSGARRRP